MSRMRQLFEEILAVFPSDRYVEGIYQSLAMESGARSVVASYDRALRSLDAESWRVLRQKAMQSFPCDIEDRGKQHFFNQLNEAFAYRFLVRQGHQQVAFVPEDTKKKRKTPDIRFLKGGAESFCEVKTIGISVDEIARTKSGEAFSTSIYSELKSPFLNKKLPDAIRTALGQLKAADGPGLVFLVVQFDDFTLQYYPVYRRQIARLLNAQFRDAEVHVKIGVQGRRRLHHGSRSACAPVPNAQ